MSQTPEDLFRASQPIMSVAEAAKAWGNKEIWLDCTRLAYKLQRQCADMLKPHYDAEPTRSIVHQSAASLAMRLGLWDESIELCDEGLRGTPQDWTERNLLNVKEICEKRRDEQA
jgi:hypothetical protein